MFTRSVKKEKTPDSFSNYFLSLGAGENQINLIKAASELGYRVIAVDQNPSAPGFQKADLQMYCSILEHKKILHNLHEKFLIAGELAGVGCRSFGKAVHSAAVIAEHFSLPGPKSENLSAFQNKTSLKKLMQELAIPTPPSYVFNEGRKNYNRDYSKWERFLPLVVRPRKGHGKRGVQLLRYIGDVRDFLEERTNQEVEEFLLDKYIDGKEITVLGFVNHGRFILVSITDKHTEYHSSRFTELQHYYPSKIMSDTVEKICEYMQKICDASCLNCSPIVAEFLLSDANSDTPIYMIECSPETGGEYIADQLIPAAFERNYFQDLVQIYTGKETQTDHQPYTQGNFQVIIRFIPQQNGCLKHVEFPASLPGQKNFLFCRYLKKSGDYTSLANGNLDRLAVFGLKAPLDDHSLHSQVEEIINNTIVKYGN